ncbi:uncharacterized protein LOC6739172 [Drosophila simulans]|uniref:GD15066 n=1 Tax=Drosophila simulans TaxID=7240 RepID=B4QLV9_DROSI|nr:uncharacterized protein LOC6739172 [Drosophila simulans]EDX11547.1 GD15066 [Drosophila simulans]KMZ01284.1 uncharacterized protein Dsimw501_GD29357 [Drosophila simulans]KMZ01286.1 uncharacterized protein Dsimw501_GD15066 [Drosophila simulans]
MDQIITSTLKNRRRRSLGLRLLICYLKKSNIKLEENVHTWTCLLVQSCKLPELCLYGDLIFSALALLMDKIQSDGNMSKAFASAHLYKVVECLSHNEIYKHNRSTIAALHTIKKCLKYYPKGLKAKVSTIKNILVLLIDNQNDEVVYQSGECWLLLHKIHGISDKEHMNNITEWKDFQLSLLSNIQYIINRTIVMPEESVSSPFIPNHFGAFTFEALKDPFERTSQAFGRIFNLIEYLKIALSKQFIFKKNICVHQILALIQNGLNTHVHQQNLQINHAYLEIFLPQMHIKLLELLEIVIKTCHTHLRMDFRLVLNILLEALEKTNKSMSQEANLKEVLNMRLVVYRVISLWCSTLQEGSHCEIIADTLIKEVFDDISTRRPTSKKSVSGPYLKHSPETPFSMLKCSLSNEDYRVLSQQAHSCLQQFLLSSGHLIKHQLLKAVHDTLLGICVQMHSQSSKEPDLVDTWDGRLEVYKSFTVLLKLRNYGCPTPSEIIWNLLHESRLFNNSIALKQSHSSNLLELMLHPQKADINFKSVDNSKKTTVFSTNETENRIDLLQTINSPEDRFCDSESPLISAIKTIENNNDDQKNTGYDNNSLNKKKPFEVVCKNYSKDLVAEDTTKNINEISDDHLLASKINSTQSLEGQPQGICNGNNLKSDLISSCCSAEESVKMFPSDLESSLDDAKMIADLEATFVGELK